MRIHTVLVENLASLYGSFRVDLDADLGGAPLFLICGPTGSGKSTFLDAIQLALFGATARLNEPVSTARDDASAGVADPRTLLSREAVQGRAQVEFSRLVPGHARRRYRATWSVSRAHKKVNGAYQAPQRTLEALEPDGTWTTLTENHQSKVYGPAFAAALGGMEVQEFNRTVLIAQGQFAQFMQAPAKDRADFLERITQTTHFRHIGQRAADAYKASKQAREAIDNQLLGLGVIDAAGEEAAQTALEAAHVERATVVAELEVVEAEQRWLAQLAHLEALQVRVASELDAATSRSEALADARAALVLDERVRPAHEAVSATEAARAAAAQREAAWRAAAELQQGLVEQSTRFVDAAAQTEAALRDATARADEMAPRIRRARELRDAIAMHGRELAAESAALTARQAACRTAAQSVTELEAALKVGAAEATALDERVSQLASDAERATQRLNDALDGAPDVTSARALLEARRRTLDDRASALTVCATAGATHARALEQLLLAEHALTSAAPVEAEAALTVAVAEQARAAAEAAMGDARDREAGARALGWVAGLRQRLRAGEPCEVCGSTEHPHHDLPVHDAASIERATLAAAAAIQAAKAQLDAALGGERGALAALQGARAVLEERRGAVQARTRDAAVALAAWHDAANAAGIARDADRAAVDAARVEIATAQQHERQQVERLNAAAEAAQAARDALLQLEKQRATVETATLQRTERLVAARDTLQVAQQAVLDSEARVRERSAQIEALGAERVEVLTDDPDAVEAQLKGAVNHATSGLETAQRAQREHVAKLTVAAEQVAHAAAELDRAQGEYVAAQGRRDGELASLGLALDEVRAARLDDVRRAELRSAVDAVDQALLTARGAKNSATEQLQVHAATVPDGLDREMPAELRVERASRLAQARDALSTEIGRLTAQLNAIAAQREQAAELHQRRNAALDDEQRWLAIHELIGTNQGKAFSDLAQALQFDELIEHANHQLRHFAPRYQLQARRRGAEVSLDFEVIDLEQAGVVRAIQTLSGGETFLTSLGLALGLANFKGTGSIETLLLDEGFGTLDPASLSQAITALRRLADEARVRVGLVSHVESLRERIPARIVLSKLGGGRSTLRVEG